jgi:hypothetical protein
MLTAVCATLKRALIICINPFVLLLIFLVALRPVRFVVGWAIILFVVFFVSRWNGWIGPG